MTEAPSTRKNPFTVLAHWQYRLLFIGTTMSMLAFGMMQVVQGVVAFDLTGKNGAVGFVGLGQGIAMLFLSPVGGTLSDRVSKKRMLTFAQFVIGFMFGVIAVLIATELITILLLAGASLILGCMYSLMGPTRQAWVGDLLTGDDLASGVGLQQLMMNVTRIVGPLVAGVLVAAEPINTSGTYFAMAGLFALVVMTLSLMQPTPPRPRAHATSVKADLLEGFRYIRDTPDVRMLAVIFMGVVLSGFSYQTLMPGYLVNALGHPATHLGLLFSTTAVGGIAVNLALASRPPRNSIAVMLFCGSGLAVSLAMLALAPSFAVALAVCAVLGASSSGFQMLNNVNLMERSESAYLGRVMAVTMMAFGVNSIVSYPIGVIADGIGERGTLGGLACACMTVVLLGVFAVRSQTARRPSPAAPGAEAATTPGR
ncbi:MAG: MFS transporter [Dehalococcoidia bacterium]|nr:MFS transporter [Dehalococcoidia bacterium]